MRSTIKYENHGLFYTVPNVICFARCLLMLIVTGLILRGYNVTGFFLGFIAGMLDAVDGWVARRFNQITIFGAMFDQMADQLTVACMLGIMLYDHKISIFFLIVYLIREFWVGIVRRYMSLCGQKIKSSRYGKIYIQFLLGGGVIFFLGYLNVVPNNTPIGLYAMIVFFFFTMYNYMIARTFFQNNTWMIWFVSIVWLFIVLYLYHYLNILSFSYLQMQNFIMNYGYAYMYLSLCLGVLSGCLYTKEMKNFVSRGE